MLTEEQRWHDFLTLAEGWGCWKVSSGRGNLYRSGARKVPDDAVLPRWVKEKVAHALPAGRPLGAVDLAGLLGVEEGDAEPQGASADSRDDVFLKRHCLIRGERAWAHGFFLPACRPHLPGKQHTRFKANRPVPVFLEAITQICRLRDRSGICREEASDVTTRGQRSSMTSGSEVEVGGEHQGLPWCWQSEPAKPGQHVQATEASTFCLTWYTGLWATRYLQEEGGSATPR